VQQLVYLVQQLEQRVWLLVQLVMWWEQLEWKWKWN
jgi:hypothetical protein